MLADPSVTFNNTGDRLFELVFGTYVALNGTSPERTEKCWPCLQSNPPNYEGIALAGNINNSTPHPVGCGTTVHTLNLAEVSGSGLCLGMVPPSHQNLCNHMVIISEGDYFLQVPDGTFFTCNTGFTPCISARKHNSTADFCVLVQLWPRLLYHAEHNIMSFYEQKHRFPHEPVSMMVAHLLGVREA